MQFPAVNWHEGLFLQPHHFQAWDRHWTERVHVGEQWQSPYSYGLLEISINSDALAAGFIQIDVLRCKTPGGAIVDCSTGQFSERRDLRPSLDVVSQSWPSGDRGTAPFLDIYVGVSRLKLGDRNVDAPDHRNGARFRSQSLDLPDELDAACVKPVELRQLNTRILFSTDDLAGYDVLRIARVRRSEFENSQVQLDRHFIPPLLDCAAWGTMRSQFLSSIYDLIQHQSELLARQVLDGGGTLHASTPIDVQRLLMLQAINPVSSVLRVMANSRGIHPLTAYLELARLAGALDLLHPTRASQLTAAYDHEDIGPLFWELKRRIMQSIESLQRPPYRQTTFVGNEHGMQVTVDRSLFATHRRWFLGVHKGTADAEIVHRAMSPGNLDWKMGSQEQVERLFTQRSVGVEIKRCNSSPAMLPKGDDWLYYEIVGMERSPWKDVESTGTLSIRFGDTILLERDRLPGQRSIQVQFGSHTLNLQFALFGAV